MHACYVSGIFHRMSGRRHSSMSSAALDRSEQAVL